MKKEYLKKLFSDDNDRGEERNVYDVQLAQQDVEAKKIKNRGAKQDIDERKYYAGQIFTLTCYWFLFIALVLVWTGLQKFVLSDAVLLALIGSTTVNATVFFYLVTKYLFPPQIIQPTTPNDLTSFPHSIF